MKGVNVLDKIWWQKISKASLFIQDIVDTLLEEKNVVLQLPKYVPWYDTFFDVISEELVTAGMQRELRELKSNQEDPGEQIKEKFCKKDVRSSHRGGISVATFIAEQNSTLHNSLVWITGLEEKEVRLWADFIKEYYKARPKERSRAQFVLELRGVNNGLSVTNSKTLSFNTDISAYDKFTFCALISSEAIIESFLKPYLAELVSTVCSDDIELCAACVGKGIEFAKNPDQCLKEIAVEETRSDGSSYEITEVLENLEHNIWKSQIRFAFPLLEEFRSRFVQSHRREISALLPVTNTFDEVINSPEEAELSLLLAMASNGMIQMKTNDELPKLRHHKQMRDSLAHLKPIDLDEVILLVN